MRKNPNRICYEYFERNPDEGIFERRRVAKLHEEKIVTFQDE